MREQRFKVRRPAWVEVHLERIVRNAARFSRMLGRAELAAVVKADAYGHGMGAVATALHRAGVRTFCVSTAEEAHQLRDILTKPRVLLMGPADRRDAADLVRRRVTLTLFTIDFADFLDRIARKLGRRTDVHLKVDTGMNRLGVPWEQAGDFVLRLGLFRGVHVEGIYSHLATALDDRSFMQTQRRRFEWCIRQMQRLRVVPRIRHLANTGGVLTSKSFHYDMARVGLGLYGVEPRPRSGLHTGLEEAMVVKGRLICVKWIEPGEGVGYGLAGKFRKLTPVGVVQVGYADGLDWRLGHIRVGKAHPLRAFYKGRALPLAGRICMDQCFLDLTQVVDEITVGEPILFLGHDPDHGTVSLWDTARRIGTIPYEVMTGFGKRLPRQYISE